MKDHQKKKLYRRKIRRHIRNGEINKADGTWVPYRGDAETKGSMQT